MVMGKGRAPCCDKSKVKQGPWNPSEDLRLTNFIQNHGHSNWRALPKLAGLMRCGKSCRLRWINYLRPDVKRGNFTPEEEQTIINLHKSFGNKWSKIASYLPGRTDNEIKNVWNTHLKKSRLLVTMNKNHKNINTSSSVTSPIDDPQNLKNVPQQINIRESADQAIKEPHDENPELPTTNPSDRDHIVIEAKEPIISSDSPTSSSYSPSSWISDPEKIEIPVDMDVDFSQFFDSPDHHGYLQSNQQLDIIGGGDQINLVEGSEIDQSKWLRFMENELVGLTSDEDFDNIPQFHPDVDLLPEDYGLLDQSATDSYFPLWQ